VNGGGNELYVKLKMGATLFSVQQEFAAWYRKIWW